MKSLEAEFEHVRRVFFPRWDRRRQWRVEEGVRSEITAEEGFCDPERKVIFLNSSVVSKGGAEFAVFLIHEICHAVVPNGSHGKIWHRRMRTVISQAQRVGREQLAELLEAELQAYQDVPVTRAEDVYSTVGDILVHLPQATFEDVIRHLASYYCLTPEELLQRYKRLKTVHEERRNFIAACEGDGQNQESRGIR